MRQTAHARLTMPLRIVAALCLLVFAGSSVPAQQPVDPHSPSYRLRAERFLRGRTRIDGNAASAMASAHAQHATLGSIEANRPQSTVSPHVTSLSTPWQPIGPNQIASLTYGSVTGRITSLAIDPADPTGNTVYLGTTGGGVWKSTNAAGPPASVSFVPLTDTLPVFSANSGTAAIPSLSIGALSVQPGTAQGAAILAGTGDPNDATDSYYGSGILRSVDGGNTWTLAVGSNDGVAGKHSFLGLGSAAFAWSTTTSSLVVAAMSQSAEGTIVNAPDAVASVLGLYYSTDAGVTWKMAVIKDGAQTVQTPLPAGGNNGGNAATSVVWNPLRQLFFAAVRFHGIYQSADGITWTRLTSQPGTGLTTTACPANPGSTGSPNCPLLRSTLAVQPLSGDTFALTVDSNNADQGLFQDVCGPTGSGCVTPAATFANRISTTNLDQSGAISQGDYDLSLAATPATTGDTVNTILYAGTIDLYRCAFPNAAASSCLLRNTTNALNGCTSPAQVAPAQHSLATLALTQPLVYVGNDGGLWRSTDGVAQTGTACSASDAGHFQNLNTSLGSLAETISLAAHPTDPNTFLLGVGANGTALTSAASSLTPWPQLAAGEGGYVAIDQTDPHNIFASTGPGVSITHCAKGTDCTSADFAGPPTIGPSTSFGEAALTDAPYLLDPALTSNILIGTCRVYRGSADDGSNYSPTNALSAPFGGPANPLCDATTNPLVRSLAAAGPLSNVTAPPNAGSTVLYAGLAGTLDGGLNAGGHVFTTTAGATANSTTTWTDTAGANVTNATGQFNPSGFDVSSIAADPHDASGKTVYATIMGFGNTTNASELYRSLNGGTTWTNISANLPKAPANSVAIDPNDANTVYVALDTGVYVTSQVSTCASANCWSILGTGLPNAPVIALVASAGVPTGDGRTGELRAATYGRGVWQIPLLTAINSTQPAISLSPTSLTFAAQPVATASAPQTVTVTNTGTAPLTISSITTTGDFTETDTCTAPGSNVLAINATCTIQVGFLPTATGARTGVLTVFGNAPGGQATVTLNGTATAPAAIVLNPITIAFPTTSVGATSAPVNITISNTGGTTATLQTSMITGADFRLSANTCGPTLASQTGCTVSIVFAPTAAGARTGTFSITDSAGTQTASLTGTATTPATDALSPLTLAFAPQVLNTASPTQTVTLTNSGDVPLTLIAAQTSPADFTVVNACGNSLNGHSACTFNVAFVPKSVGSITGTLTVSDQFRTQTISLNGTGLAPAGVSLSPFATVAFPITALGVTSQPATVTLTNNGGVPLSIQGATLTGDFAIVTNSNTCPASLPPSTACTLQVVFVPTLGGPRSGTLTFTDSAANSPQALTLTGTGVDFTLTANGPTTVTIASGASAVFPFLLTSPAGTPGNAAFTCLGAPTNATCNITPQNPALDGTTTIAVTIATGVTPTAANHPPSPTSPRNLFWFAALLPLSALLLRRRASARFLLLRTTNNFCHSERSEEPPYFALAFGKPTTRKQPQNRTRLLLLLAAATLPLVLSSCGVARAIPATTSTGNGGSTIITPSGSYSIAVSATSAGLTRTVNVTLIVQ